MGNIPRHDDVVDVVLKGRGAAAADANIDAVFAPFDGFIENVYGVSRVAGVTGTMVADVNKNGTTIFAAAAKITWATAVTVAGTISALTSNQVSKGDEISFDIDSVHSGTAAELAMAHIRFNRRNQGTATNVAPASLT